MSSMSVILEYSFEKIIHEDLDDICKHNMFIRCIFFSNGGSVITDMKSKTKPTFLEEASDTDVSSNLI